MSLYDERLERTLKAVRMEKVDEIPFSYSGSAYVAHEMGVTIADFVHNYELATTTSVNFANKHPEIDTFQTPIMCPPSLATVWLSRIKVPGEDLPDDYLWQVDEQEVVKPDDYQKIIDMGYGPWVDQLMKERLGDPISKCLGFFQYMPTSYQRMAAEANEAVINGGNGCTPFEGFCGGRTLANFFVDLMDEPELVKKAYNIAFEASKAGLEAQLANKPIGAWVGGWRAAPELMSHEMWMEWVWPYLEELVHMTVDAGVVAILHFDSCWDRELDMIATLPERKCILMLDGKTDIHKARAALGDNMCIMGDVPASMLAFGTPEETYDYTTGIIRDIGPETGLIVSSGCDCPLNANPDNVNAMLKATKDWKVL